MPQLHRAGRPAETKIKERIGRDQNDQPKSMWSLQGRNCRQKLEVKNKKEGRRSRVESKERQTDSRSYRVKLDCGLALRGQNAGKRSTLCLLECQGHFYSRALDQREGVAPRDPSPDPHARMLPPRPRSRWGLAHGVWRLQRAADQHV